LHRQEAAFGAAYQPEATAYRALIENIIRLVEDSPDMAPRA
jgi:hypothetical protein